METADFRTVYASVRPARIAVLVNRGDSDWTETCRRTIEFFSGLWGGEHSLIIPTDGLSIPSVFWDLLEAFDPDYICSYHKTGKDLKMSAPERFQQAVEAVIQRDYTGQNVSELTRLAIEKAISSSTFPLGVDHSLEKYHARR